jgi:hypothetical protein
MTTMVTPMRRATDRLARSCAIGLALACVGLAALVLIGWIGGIEPLKRVVPGYVAMVPTTAVCLLLIGGGLFLTLSTPNRHAGNLSMALSNCQRWMMRSLLWARQWLRSTY